MLDMHLFRRIIDEVHETLMYLMLYFQGEPYLHPGFTELVRYARKRNIYTAASTNGHYLNPQNAEQTVRAGLDKLIVSIDGLEQDTYEKYRVGGVLDTVMEGIDNLIDARARLGSSRPFIEAQFIVFGHNEHEIPRFREMCRQRGIAGSVKTAQLYDRQEWRGFLPSDAGYSRYTHSDGVLSIKNRLLNHCWKMWHSAVVTWDGRVVPCCFDKDADHVMGTLDTQRFEEIWDSANYRAFRASLLNGRKNIGICTNCSEGTRVWL